MIHYSVLPRTEEWRKLRVGLPTASNFHRIVTPGSIMDPKKEAKLSTQSRQYLCELLCEWLLGMPIEDIKMGEGRPTSTAFMERGAELEDQAYKWYELERDIETEPAGFFTTDDGVYGASPDRCWPWSTGARWPDSGERGGVELKCPAMWTHMQYLIECGVDEDHFLQVQGQMLCADWDFVDVVSYHPELPGVIVPVKRDELACKKLDTAVRAFAATLERTKADLLARGIKPKPIAPPADHSQDYITDEDEAAAIEWARRNAGMEVK